MHFNIEISPGSNREGMTLTSLELSGLSDVIYMFLEEMHKIPQQAQSVYVSLHIVVAEEIQRLNHQYRFIDEVTDVLSFPLWELDGQYSPAQDWQNLPLGDVVLCTDYILRHAQKENLNYNHELRLMIVHGILHLIGYDHDTPEKKDEMWCVQDKIVADSMNGPLRRTDCE